MVTSSSCASGRGGHGPRCQRLAPRLGLLGAPAPWHNSGSLETEGKQGLRFIVRPGCTGQTAEEAVLFVANVAALLPFYINT